MNPINLTDSLSLLSEIEPPKNKGAPMNNTDNFPAPVVLKLFCCDGSIIYTEPLVEFECTYQQSWGFLFKAKDINGKESRYQITKMEHMYELILNQ